MTQFRTLAPYRILSKTFSAALILLVCAASAARADDPFSDAIILSDKQIEVTGLPENTHGYNPSIIALGTGSLLVFRVDHTDGYGSTRIGAVELDADYKQIGQPSLLDLRPEGMPRHTAEDPRLMWCEQEICLVYNLTRQNIYAAPRTLNIAKLVLSHQGDDTVSVSAPVQVGLRVPEGSPQSLIEKNWTPFMHNHRVHFIYTTNPPHVMELPDNSFAEHGSIVALKTVSQEAPLAHWPGFPHGEMRGGSPALLDEESGHYLSFFHGKHVEQIGYLQKHHLTIGLYSFSPEPPFAIEQVIAQPIVPDNFHQSDTPTLSCAYPGGFMMRGASTVMVYGYQDQSIHVMHLDTKALRDAMIDVGSSHRTAQRAGL